MLTIKPPIKLRCRFPLETVHRDLSEKITGNYSIMNNYIRKEELLYVTTQSPEVYFAEGNNISILNDIKNDNYQEIRLDIINQLVNRILMSDTENFSYQDNVYISNVLRKIGIQDISSFMKQVYSLREEKRENNKLINLYEEQRDMLINIFNEENIQQENNKSKSKEEAESISANYYIHQDIYNRLNTEKIYEDIRNFTQGIESNTTKISRNEMAVSEQISMISNFNLNSLKNEVMNRNQPIYYYHANEYELVEENIMDKQTPEERISAAILLNLVDQIYSLRINQIEKNAHNWYSVAGALFQTSENTWKRYEINHKEGKKVISNMYDTMVEIVNNKQNERNIINNIINQINEYKEENVSEFNTEYRDDTLVKQTIEKFIEQKELSFTNNYQMEETINNLNKEFSVINNNNNINLEQITDLTYLEQNIDETVNNSESIETTNEIIRNLETINNRNIENYKRILEIEQSRPKLKDVRVDKEKAKADALRALENPNEVLLEYMNSEETNQYNEVNIKFDEQFYNLLSEETKNIFMEVSRQQRGETPNMYQSTDMNHKDDSKEQIEKEIINNIEKEVVENITNNQSDSTVEMVQKTSIDYGIDENIINKIEQLNNTDITNIHNEYYGNEADVKKKRESINKTIIDMEKKEKEKPELLHITNEIESGEGNIADVQGKTATSDKMTEIKVDKKVIASIINENMKNEINQLINTDVTNLYENYFAKEETVKKKRGRKSKALIEMEEKKEKENLELLHFMNQAELEENVINPTQSTKTVSSQNTVLIHKVDEQVITEDLINTIKDRSVENVKQETVEHNEIHNVNRNEKQINETVNQIKLHKQENIDELVKQNVKKQINQLTDQVYGKIEKRLKTERKRRGY